MKLINKDYAVDTAWSIEVYHGSAREVCEMLEDAPTVEAIPVIRCKDCKRCQNSTVLICGKPKEIFYCDGARKMAVAQYDYCSWAERKEE